MCASTLWLSSVLRHLPLDMYPLVSRHAIRRWLVDFRLKVLMSISISEKLTSIWQEKCDLQRRHLLQINTLPWHLMWKSKEWDADTADHDAAMHFDGSRLHFATSDIAFAIKSLRSHLSAGQCSSEATLGNILRGQEYDITSCPSRSTDITQIEHVWDMLGRRLQTCQNTT